MNCIGGRSRLASWEKIRKRLPLGEMAENFGLTSKSMRAKKGRKTYFTPEGKVALMFLKMYTGLSSPKLMEHLNGNVHYQLFCDARIDPMHPLTNYKLLDDVFSELARGLKIQQQQEIECQAECAPSEDEVRRRREGQPVVQEAAQAYESPDQETDQTPAQPFGEDTEGDPHTGEGECRRGEIADSQTEERY